MPSVYVETTIPSYLTARPAKNVIAAAHQAITREWWESRRQLFDLYTSRLVVEEASIGDLAAIERRLQALEGIPLLTWSDDVEWIAGELEWRSLLPSNATADGFHIAYASVHAMDYLLTWNCRHLANAERLPAIEEFLADAGFHVPVVCTPEELLGDTNEAAD